MWASPPQSNLKQLPFGASIEWIISEQRIDIDPLHYRLRCSIGFLNVKKKFKSEGLFLTQGTPKYDNFAFFVKIMTQILYQKNFITFSENKYVQNHGQCWKFFYAI